MVMVGKPFKAQTKHQSRERKACYTKVRNILDFDDSGADMIEVNEARPFVLRKIVSDEEDKNERQSSMSGSERHQQVDGSE